jgi:short subunit dehydrogenase-like uncharacterized protein
MGRPNRGRGSPGPEFFLGEVSAQAGQRAVSRMRGAQSYTLTVQAALGLVERVLAGAPAGFLMPATAFGPDFVLGLEGMVRAAE